MRSPEDDIDFTTTVRARRLRFHDAPESRVTFRGTSEHESTSDRARLPDPVEPGVTYSDIRVDYRLAAAVPDPAGEPEATDPEPDPDR